MDSSSAAARTIATLGIWAAVTILGIGTLVNSVFLDGGAVVLVIAILFGAALIATQLVWRGSSSGNREQAEKSKRRTRVDNVLDRLSDEEIEDLRARLTSNTEGEYVSLDEVLYESEKRLKR